MNHLTKLFRSIALGSTALTGVCLVLAIGSNDAYAQQATVLEEITVTATKREENIQDVAISITSMTGQRLDARFTGGETILALAAAAPGLYAESSNGRHAPRFYMRGLGNADFDQAASQPVSVVFDEVPMEQVTLKAFPLFDIGSVEVIRGPQGTLYGRNTTAGIIKINSRRPDQEFDGYVKGSAGSLSTYVFEGAVGGGLIDDVLSARFSLLYQDRGNWINNGFTGEDDVLGGFNEVAGRLQFLWTPSDNFSALLLHQRRDLGGNSASAFRANTVTAGTNDLNSNYIRDTVWYDGGGGNPAQIEANGTNLTLDWDVASVTLTSISSWQDAEQTGRGDIDGGIVDPTLTIPTPPGIQCVDAAFVIPIFGPARTCPDFIFISSDTGGHNFNKQFTQEFRVSSNNDGAFNYQAGFFYFDDELSTSTEFGVGPNPEDTVVGAIAFHENTTWAVFAQGSYDFTDQLNMVVGVRYTDDEKSYTPTQAPPTQTAVLLEDTNVSWDISLAYSLTDVSQIYGRIATGFRAPTIQARNAAFGDPITFADSETILSYEIGYKADLADRLRLNTAIFYYKVDDMQLTAIGGASNAVTLLNADNGTGAGFEIDVDWLATDNLTLSGGFGYNDTSINDSSLAITAGIGAVNVLDPLDADGNPLIDGNPFQHAPDWTMNLELAYDYPLSSGNSLFLFTDWKFKGDTNEFLYESIEFQNDMQYEGGLRFGYRNNTHNYEIAVFGRNITDEDNAIGGIDFSNTTIYVNEPQIWGLEASISFD